MADALAQACTLLPSPLDLECKAMVEVPVMMVIGGGGHGDISHPLDISSPKDIDSP